MGRATAPEYWTMWRSPSAVRSFVDRRSFSRASSRSARACVPGVYSIFAMTPPRGAEEVEEPDAQKGEDRRRRHEEDEGDRRRREGVDPDRGRLQEEGRHDPRGGATRNHGAGQRGRG